MGRRKADLDRERLLALYAEHGSLVTVGKILGVSDRTITRHRQADPDLDQALTEARQQFLTNRRLSKPHGTRSRYPWCTDGEDGRACGKCRAANGAHQKRQNKRRRKVTPFDKIPHGTTTGYDDYGCKCSKCCTAKAQANRAYRQRIAQRSGMVVRGQVVA